MISLMRERDLLQRQLEEARRREVVIGSSQHVCTSQEMHLCVNCGNAFPINKTARQ